MFFFVVYKFIIMKRLKTSYKIDNKRYIFPCNAQTFKGKNEVLIDHGNNLLVNTNFSKFGYKVVSFKNSFSHSSLKNYISNYIKRIIEKELKVKIKKFDLKKYHKYVDQKVHFTVLKKLSKGIKFSNLFPKSKIERFMSQTLNMHVTTLNSKYRKKINPNVFLVRIIRPTKYDFNPPHRDVYFERYRSAVNIYIPIAGSNKKSSLPIFPKSHIMNESSIERTSLNSSFNNFRFSVPIIVKTFPALKLIRPNPKNNQLMIFSSYLIHGGAKNENKDITRVSVELRFWRKN